MFERGVVCVLLCVALSCDDEPDVQPTPSLSEERGDDTDNADNAEAVAEPDSEQVAAEREASAPEEAAEPAVGTIEPGDPVDDGSLERAPARVSARVRRLREGEEARDNGGDMIAPDRFVFGLPAMSADGRRIALVEHSGDEFNWDTHVLILSVPGGRQVRAFHTNSGSLEQENDEAFDEAAREAAALPFRRVARDANVYLREGEFRSMIPIPQRPHDPALRRVPLLLWAGERTDEVIIRDPGNSAARYHALPLDQPREPVDLDNDEPDHECDTDTPQEVRAWFAPDPDTIMLYARYEHAADWCPSEHFRDVFRLPALRSD